MERAASAGRGMVEKEVARAVVELAEAMAVVERVELVEMGKAVKVAAWEVEASAEAAKEAASTVVEVLEAAVTGVAAQVVVE